MSDPQDDLPSFAGIRGASGPDPGCFNFWNVQSSGDDFEDYARGQALAVEALAYSQRHRSAAAIAFALAAIAERGHVGVLEAGFIVRLARAAHAGSLN